MQQDEESFSEAVQDYLKAIYELSPAGSPVSTNQIAERLGVAPASVTGMLKRLSTMKPALVEYHKHHGARLTEEGQRISLQMIRKHRLIELFLMKVLGYTWDEVHGEAERLEHAVSFLFVERLARLLNQPDFDPHGDPIPDRDLNLPEMQTVPLSQVLPGQQVIVRRVQSSEAALLRYLEEIGVLPGAQMQVLAQIPFDHTVRVQVAGGEERVLGQDISKHLHVEIQ